MFWVIDKAGDKFTFGSIDDLFDYIVIRGEANITEGYVSIS